MSFFLFVSSFFGGLYFIPRQLYLVATLFYLVLFYKREAIRKLCIEAIHIIANYYLLLVYGQAFGNLSSSYSHFC